jgi:hypothetical protein
MYTVTEGWVSGTGEVVWVVLSEEGSITWSTDFDQMAAYAATFNYTSENADGDELYANLDADYAEEGI